MVKEEVPKIMSRGESFAVEFKAEEKSLCDQFVTIISTNCHKFS